MEADVSSSLNSVNEALAVDKRLELFLLNYKSIRSCIRQLETKEPW
jgi:hypothetical protein